MQSRKVPLRRDETLTEAGHPRHADDGPQRRPQPVLKSISKDKRCAETAERHKAGPTHSKPTRTRGRADVVDDRSSVVAAGGAKASTPSSPSDAASFDAMKIENMRLLSQDRGDTWHNGVARLSTSRASAASVLAWVIEHTSRKTSVIVTNTLRVDGFQNWEHVHAGSPNDERQRAHTFVITRAQRRHALLHIPGLSGLVAEAKGAVESLRLHDMPAELEWLHGHILNQGDVNARFEYHQDTGEERSRISGRRDRCVLYTVIIKLNRGGCTSMQVCGLPEVFYRSSSGTGVMFRSEVHHCTAKAEPGIWKFAMFFGVYY